MKSQLFLDVGASRWRGSWERGWPWQLERSRCGCSSDCASSFITVSSKMTAILIQHLHCNLHICFHVRMVKIFRVSHSCQLPWLWRYPKLFSCQHHLLSFWHCVLFHAPQTPDCHVCPKWMTTKISTTHSGILLKTCIVFLCTNNILQLWILSGLQTIGCELKSTGLISDSDEGEHYCYIWIVSLYCMQGSSKSPRTMRKRVCFVQTHNWGARWHEWSWCIAFPGWHA